MKNDKFIPYNKRPLTAALKDSFSRDNSKTLMFINISLLFY